MSNLLVRDGQYKPLKVLPHLGDQPKNKVNYLMIIFWWLNWNKQRNIMSSKSKDVMYVWALDTTMFSQHLNHLYVTEHIKKIFGET